ncbi:MAG: glycoside hydrolase family 25 [Lachnospiraceae bacterium]|nr:glycoside hydrolase family 25 [Lachnospiraceae bacterium]
MKRSEIENTKRDQTDRTQTEKIHREGTQPGKIQPGKEKNIRIILTAAALALVGIAVFLTSGQRGGEESVSVSAVGKEQKDLENIYSYLDAKNDKENLQGERGIQELGQENSLEDSQEGQQEKVSDLEETEKPEGIKSVPQEEARQTWGIDVSEHQEIIDWQEVAAGGVDFAMVRVGYRRSVSGELVEDRCARYNLQEASQYGVYLGAYFFSTAVSEEEAREEARWVCDLLAGYPVTYPVVYNCEGFENESSRQYGMTLEERTQLAQVFLDQVEREGYTGMFYGARSELEHSYLWDTGVLEERYRMWVAYYSKPSYPEVGDPDYSGSYAMWQYTDQGRVPGIETVVDLNVAYIGYEQAAKPLREGAAVPVEPHPEIGVTFEEVQEQVTALDEINLRRRMDQNDPENIVTQLKNGQVALRTGKGSNGWSRLWYQGQTVYAVTRLLTEDLEGEGEKQ